MKKKSTKNTIHNKKYQCFSVYWYKKDGCILSKLHQSIKGINRLNIPNAFLRKISGTAVAYAENNIHIPFYWQIRQIFDFFVSDYGKIFFIGNFMPNGTILFIYFSDFIFQFLQKSKYKMMWSHCVD